MGWLMTRKERQEEKKLNQLFKARYRTRKKIKKPNNSRWYPGKFKGARQSVEYANWRKAVLQRDNYTCVQCGEVGGKLHAHHRLSFFHNKDLRFDIDNGITLCVNCHEDLHGFPIGSNNSSNLKTA